MNIPRMLLVVLVLSGVGALTIAVLAMTRSEQPGPRIAVAPAETRPRAAAAAPRPEVAVAAVLRSWDVQRAGAWAVGDMAGLGRLYVAGSAAGRADRAMLRAWVARGWVVRGLRTQVLALRLVDRSPDRLRIRVTDRVSGAQAVRLTPGVDDVRRGLPWDAPTSRVLTMRRIDGRWLMSSVRLGAGPGR